MGNSIDKDQRTGFIIGAAFRSFRVTRYFHFSLTVWN